LKKNKNPDFDKPKVIILAGPTGSGKTSFGVKLALDLDAEIINADSMQVYRGMDIGTATPTPDEQKGIPHHLFNIVDPDEEFNAALYRERALPVIRDITIRNKVCIILGGTGLYIKSLLEGLFKCPARDLGLREKLGKECDLYGSQRLYERLAFLDADYAKKIHPNDKLRIIRGLEIFHLTNDLPSSLIKAQQQSKELDPLMFYLTMDRKKLYEMINLRSEAMLEAGLLDETKKLLENGYSPSLKSMKAIGYRHMIKVINGEYSMEDALEILKRDTRRYAKRQLTWFAADAQYKSIFFNQFYQVKDEITTFLVHTV